MEKTISINIAQNLSGHKEKLGNLICGLLMAAMLFAPNIVSTAFAQDAYLETDSSVELLNDSVTFREITVSDNGTTETITTYEESYIYTDTVTRYLPNSHHVPQQKAAIANYGSFRVISANRAEMVGTTDSYSMQRFNQMIAAFPHIKQIDMIDVAGTVDDEVNLALASKIHSMNIATHIPQYGSVRSGGVELFLAGKKRTAHPTANFAVHSWQDEDGLQPHDYADNHPVHAAYINYYRNVAGMSAQQARDFYWMTNSAPHDSSINLTVHDIAQYAPFSRT